MALQDPFGTTYEGARKGYGAFGEALQQTATSYAERKQREREMQMKGGIELGLEKEKAKLKQQYPDPLTALIMSQLGGGQTISPPTTREEAVSKLKEEGKDPADFKIKEQVISGPKGTKSLGYVAEEIPKKLFNTQQEKSINDLTYTINLIKTIKDKAATGKYKTGPLAGRFSALMPFNQLYMGAVGKPEEAAFKSDLTEAMASYATAKTGAQRGFREIQWLEAALPSGTLTPEQIVGTKDQKGVADAAIERLEKNLLQVLSNAKKSRFDVSGFESDMADLESRYEYIRTGVNKKTGKKFGMKADGTIEEIL